MYEMPLIWVLGLGHAIFVIGVLSRDRVTQMASSDNYTSNAINYWKQNSYFCQLDLHSELDSG